MSIIKEDDFKQAELDLISSNYIPKLNRNKVTRYALYLDRNMLSKEDDELSICLVEYDENGMNLNQMNTDAISKKDMIRFLKDCIEVLRNA